MPHIAFTVSSFLEKNVDQYNILVFNKNLFILSRANLKDHLKERHLPFINLLLIIFMHVEIHIKLGVLSLEHHHVLLHNATLKHGINSGRTCADTGPTGKLMFTYKLKQLAILNFL